MCLGIINIIIIRHVSRAIEQNQTHARPSSAPGQFLAFTRNAVVRTVRIVNIFFPNPKNCFKMCWFYTGLF